MNIRAGRFILDSDILPSAVVYIEPANDEYNWFAGCRWLVVEKLEKRVTGFAIILAAKEYVARVYGVTRWERERVTRGWTPKNLGNYPTLDNISW